MLKSKKNVFWEALVVTIVIFLAGLLFGIYMESLRSEEIDQFYTQSEISLTDTASFASILEGDDFDCDIVKQANLDLANKVYEEAVLLEQYEESGRITDGMKLLHRKYDLLRTIMWTSNQNFLERCENYDLVVYLYEYETEEVNAKATQSVWSKILRDLKNEMSDDLLLIPIAADQNLTSLDLLMEKYDVSSFPAVVVNNEEVLYELDNVDQIKNLIDEGTNFEEIVLA